MMTYTPPMGWNSWNTFGTDINEQIVLETADAIVKLGLDKVGYKYVVVDDGWEARDRDPVTNRLVADPVKFPHGMKYVADYVHSLGLKFGIYSCAGLRTCGNLPASMDHEFLDAKTFAEWEVDFLKYDGCFIPPNIDIHLLYRRMGMALKASGREIMFSLCTGDHSKDWAREVGGSMYRSTGDISDSFESIKNIIFEQEHKFCYSAPGCYNDLDMLTV
ncbi:MAG: glycoside hydrolase family 27 protein, partial [Clostridia bacterium]|nr:glycoside hydrolase family 27 protein [Clostridia bacterium]